MAERTADIIKKYKKGMIIAIVPSYACNYKCEYCVRDLMELEYKKDHGFDKWKEFLTDLDENLRCGGTRIKEIVISGGEPTLLPYFVDLCNWILSKKWYLTISTNLSNYQTLKLKKNNRITILAAYHKAQVKKDIFRKRWDKIKEVHKIKVLGVGNKDFPDAIYTKIRTEKFKDKGKGKLTVDANFKISNYTIED